MSASAPPRTSEQVQVYGLDASQPCRSVTWLLRMHDIPFKYIFIQPGYEQKQKKTTSEIVHVKVLSVSLDGSPSVTVFLQVEERGWVQASRFLEEKSHGAGA